MRVDGGSQKEGPERHTLTCNGALTAPRDQVNTEFIASLQTEEGESAIQTPGRDECSDLKKKRPQLGTTWHRKDTWLSREMSNRHFREENTSAKEDMRRETENLGRACPMSVLPVNAQQEESGTLPPEASETQVGVGEQHSPYSGPTCGRVRTAGPSSREGTGVEKSHGAGPHSCPISAATLHRSQFTGQGLVQNQDSGENQQIPPTIHRTLPSRSGNHYRRFWGFWRQLVTTLRARSRAPA